MNIIERKLLAVTLPNVDIDMLAEIIDATPNPTLAVEIMCGLYKSPVIPQITQNNGRIMSFKSFDKWNGRLHYSFEQPKKVNEYYPSETDKESITEENYLKLRCSYREGHTYSHTITLSTIETRTDYMSLEQWLKYHEANPFTVQHAIDLTKKNKIDAIIEKM